MKDLNTDRPGGHKKTRPLDQFKSLPPEKRDRLVTRILMGAVICAVAGYTLYTMLPGKTAQDGTEQAAENESTENQENNTSPLEGVITDVSGSQEAVIDNNADAAVGDADNADINENGYAPTGGTTLYAINKNGEKKFEIHIPLNYGTFNSAGGTYVKPSDMDVFAEGNDPLYFSWSQPSGYDSLLSDGGINFLEGQGETEYAENYFQAIDYYTASDINNNEIQVILARRVTSYKPEAEFPLDDIDEYYMIVECGDALPFTGRVSSYALGSSLSQRYPTLNDLARAMVTPVSEPGFPEYWTKAYGMEIDTGINAGTEEAADGGQAAGENPGNMSGSDTAPGAGPDTNPEAGSELDTNNMPE